DDLVEAREVERIRGAGAEQEELLEGQPRPGRDEDRLAARAARATAQEQARELPAEPEVDQTERPSQRPLVLEERERERLALELVEPPQVGRDEEDLHRSALSEIGGDTVEDPVDEA